MDPIVKKAWFKPYTHIVTHNDITYHVKVLPVTKRHLVTVNSKYIWNIKTGSAKGLQYKTHSSNLVPLQDFLALANPIIVFKERPYKILKYLNESDIEDISSESSVHGIPFYSNLSTFVEQLSKK